MSNQLNISKWRQGRFQETERNAHFSDKAKQKEDDKEKVKVYSVDDPNVPLFYVVGVTLDAKDVTEHIENIAKLINQEGGE